MNKKLLYISLLLVAIACKTPIKTTDSKKIEFAIDSIQTPYLGYFSKVYTISEYDSLIQNRTQFDKMFREDDCFNCETINIPDSSYNNSNTIGKTAIGIRKSFDYQYWGNGTIKINNFLNYKNNTLCLDRIEYDSFNNPIQKEKFIFIKDTALPTYEFKVSG